MLPMSFELIKNNFTLAAVSKNTWWLTAFCMGQFSRPRDLYLSLTIRFPGCEMLRCFLDALLDTGLPENCIQVSGTAVHVLFGMPPDQSFSLWIRFFRSLAQFINQIFCRLFLFLTRDFTLTSDRLLYLYFLIPFISKKIFSPRKCKRCYSKYRNS